MSDGGGYWAPAPQETGTSATLPGGPVETDATGRRVAEDGTALEEGAPAPASSSALESEAAAKTPLEEKLAVEAAAEAAEAAKAAEAAAGASRDAGNGENTANKAWFELLPIVLQKVHERGELPLQFALPRCSKCSTEGEDAPAEAELKCTTAHCEMRNLPSCASCFMKAHEPLQGPGHRIQDLSKCPLCQVDRVAFWCKHCDLVFCDACYSDIHSVGKARLHHRFAVEGASGTMISKANWSSKFHATVMQTLAVLKRPYSSDVRKPVAPATGKRQIGLSDANPSGKRKRDFSQVEVIRIDSDSGSDSAGGQAPSPELKRMNNNPQSSSTYNSSNNSMIRPSSTPPLEISNPAPAGAIEGSARSVADQLQPVPAMPYRALAEIGHNVPTLSSSAPSPPLPKPIAFPPELMDDDSPYGNASHFTPSAFGSANIAAPLNQQQHRGFSVGFNSAAMDVSSRGFNVPPVQTSNHGSSTPGWSTAFPAPSTSASMLGNSTPVNVAMANGMMTSYNMATLGPATVNITNPLEEAMLDRYDVQNRVVFDLECKIERLNRGVITATSLGPYAGAPLMAKLVNMQTALKNAINRRDHLFVLAIVQSMDVILKIQQLRVAEFMDVPQVPLLSHRKCLQLSATINDHKTTLRALNEQLAAAIGSAGTSNASAVNSTLQRLSASIAAHEQSMKQLVEDRQSEFLRIVQFSASIREALKQEFHRFRQQRYHSQHTQ